MTDSRGGATRPADSCKTGGDRTHDSLDKERHVVTRHYNAAIAALTLIRIGQQLGTDSPAARAVHDLLELLASVAGVLSR